MKKNTSVGRSLDLQFGSLVKLRRGLPLVSLAAAVIGLGGCSHGNGAAPTADSEVTFEKNPPRQQVERSENYANLEAALDRVDQERIIAAAEKKNQAIAAANTPVKTTVTKTAVETTPVANAVDAVTPPSSPSSSSPSAPVSTSHMEAPVASLAVPGVPSISANSVTEITTPEILPTASATPTTMPTTAMGAMTAVTPVLAEVAPTPTPVALVPNEKISVEEALGVLRKHVSEHPTLNTALAMALLDGSEGKIPDPAAGNALPTADQKLFADLLAGLSGMSGSAPTASVSDRAAPLVNIAKKWEAAADLALPRLALASRVDSFGVFTPVDAKFVQGVKHTVIIYCEVANFVTKSVDGGWYETHLSQQETLITEDGLLVWRPNAEDVEDRSMNQRHDFYLVKKLTIPDNLAVGKYTLRMSVTDRNGKGIAMKNLDLEITDK